MPATPNIGDIFFAPTAQKSLSTAGSPKLSPAAKQPSFQQMVKDDRQQMYKLMGAAMETASSTMMLKEGDPGETMTQLMDMTIRMHDMDSRQKEGQTMGDIAEAIKDNRRLTESLLATQWAGNETQVKSTSFDWAPQNDHDPLNFVYDLKPSPGVRLQQASLVITDKAGRVMHVEPFDTTRQGTNLSHTWGGNILAADAEGTPRLERLKDGTYNVHIVAQGAEGEDVPVPIYMNRTIKTAILSDTESPRLSIGDQTFGLNEIRHYKPTGR